MSIFQFILLSLLAYVFFNVIYYLFIIPVVYRSFYANQGMKGRPFIPLIGDLLLLRHYIKIDRQHYFFEDLVKKYNSKIFFHSLGPMFRIVVCDPVSLADILSTKNTSHFHKSAFMKRTVRDLIGDLNLLLLEDQTHKLHRKLLSPMFHFSNLRSMINSMWGISEKMMDRLEKGDVMKNDSHYQNSINGKLLAKGDEAEIEIYQFFNQMTLEMAVYFVFGASFYSDEKSHGLPEGSMEIISNAFTENLVLIQKRILGMIAMIPLLNALPLASKKKIDYYNKSVDDVVDILIKNRIDGVTKSKCEGPDLLDLLIKTTRQDWNKKMTSTNNEGQEGGNTDKQSNTDKEKELLTVREIKDEAKTFILAGSETTGNLLSWCSYLLSEHRDIQDRLQKEVDTVLANNGGEINDKCLGDLVLLDAVIHESLRIFPPAPALVREVVEECTIETSEGKPLHLKKGTDVILSIKLAHNDKKVWGEDVEEFKPDRFLKGKEKSMINNQNIDAAVDGRIVHDDHHSSTESKEKRRPIGSFIPFSLGQRSCIGQHFALNEAKIAMASMISRYEWRLSPGQKIIPEMKVTLRPKYGLKLLMKKRTNINKL